MFRYAVLCLAAGLASARYTGEPFRPQWSPVYVVEGVIYIPSHEIKEPFKAWFDSNQSISRIDYYDGTVKTYQIPNSKYPDKGMQFKIFPIPTEGKPNELICFADDAKKDVKIQQALPDVADFKLIGSENLYDAEAWKWQLEVVNENFRYQLTLWVKYEERGGGVMSIPMKYEVHKYDILHGTQMDYFYLDYTHYHVANGINIQVFNMNGYSCMRKPNASNVNPMEGFMRQVHIKHESKEFDLFKLKHDRQYLNDLEHEKRMNIFHQNLRYIESHNRAGRGFTLAVNHLADRTPEELAAMNGLRYTAESSDNQGLPFPYSDAEIEALSEELPEQFDWRPYGAVTPVKSQLDCGSCWAFSTVGAVEGALFLHSDQKQLVRLSEQALIDCSWDSYNHGCDGGTQPKAYKWLMKHGLPTYEEYGGYLGENGRCHSENMTNTVTVKDWFQVKPNDENALKLAIYKHGPIAVSIDASNIDFKLYSRGVYYEPKCEKLHINHAVLAVGYGIFHGEKYWLIKNSWGPQWGSDGYMLMSAKGNSCGVLTEPSYVTISKSIS